MHPICHDMKSPQVWHDSRTWTKETEATQTGISLLLAILTHWATTSDSASSSCCHFSLFFFLVRSAFNFSNSSSTDNFSTALSSSASVSPIPELPAGAV
jgi:hypothetical protein